ncbi:hypothetical protein [Anaeromyxobacter oryzae]|uniref:Uncharacterized protein n=1 Tax=Anaeromyxobacter oryzae TaxID=2918170 RepID=A0ABM7WUG4_9BACT|nr:hypothetical protein [Anaeromyxobacter oryzae]BDG03127.1 hypothetical protein AMOR_21230 [Anaeromyxobacter oryzae]
MWFAPYEKVTLESPLQPDELADRLSSMVEPPRMFRWPWDPSERSFEGRVEGRRFRIWRLLKFERNSFQPVLVGEIAPSHRGSTVRVVLRLHRVVAGFMVLWLAFPLSTAIWTQVERGRGGLDALFLLAFAAFGYLICTVPFRLEVRRALRLLAPLATVAPSAAARLTR